MHQLTLFAPAELTPTPTKKSFKAKPAPTKESRVEVDSSIATKLPEPTQTEAPRVIQISLNQSPTVPAKPIVISYEISEPIAIGDTVMLRDGTVGTVKKYAYNDKDLPTGVKPCQQEGLREIVVSTAAGERCVYAYQLRKIDLLTSPPEKPSTNDKPAAKGKVLSMFTTRTRAEKMGKSDPFLAGIKTCTRRLMAPSTADYYQRAFISGQTIQIYSSGQYAGGVKWADVRLTRAPYEEALKDMPVEDLVAEGDLWESKDEFIADLCLGRPDPEAKPWVLWFEVVKMYV